MSSIIYCNNLELLHTNLYDDVPGFKNYKRISKFVMPGNSFIDRSGVLQDPFRTKFAVPLAEYDPNFKLSYHDCCMHRVMDFDEQHKRTGKKFQLMYSGGIDSTVILAAFINYYGLDKTSEIMELSCSPEAISENPWVWDRYIRKGKFKLVSSFKHTSSWDSSLIRINGEVNDQLFTGDSLAKYKRNRDLYSRKNFDDFINAAVGSKTPDSEYYITFTNKVLESAPFPLLNYYMYIWWRGFTVYYGTNHVKQLTQIPSNKIPDTYIENNFGQFFGSDYFQKWSMVWHRDYPESFCDHDNQKKPSKDFIMSILNAPEYSDKMKNKSYPRLHNKRRQATFIDDEYNIYWDWKDLGKFIEPNNSYV